jgi:hypothetical protein
MACVLPQKKQEKKMFSFMKSENISLRSAFLLHQTRKKEKKAFSGESSDIVALSNASPMAAASRIPKTRTRFQLAVLLVHDCNEFRVEKLFLKSTRPRITSTILSAQKSSQGTTREAR